MIARLWHGAVPLAKSDAYLALMKRHGLPDYHVIPGNRGAWCLHRREGDVVHFEMLTFWDDVAAIKRFAGEDYERAKYYDFDPGYLIEMEQKVRHYEMES